MTKPKPIQHGTTTGYSHHKCRCDACRAASAAYMRKRAQAIREGTWQPVVGSPKERQHCSFAGCDRLARYLVPEVLCKSHYLQRWYGNELAPLRPIRKVKNGLKECRLCAEVKPVDAFYRAGKNIQSQCKDCTAVYSRALRYGLAFDEMKRLMAEPCAGCGAIELSGHDLHIDHCHDSGKVRGVLCNNCNAVLTKHMTPEILRRLAAYLEVNTAD